MKEIFIRQPVIHCMNDKGEKSTNLFFHNQEKINGKYT